MKLPRDVVLFSTADWDHPFWTNKQHIASHLAERGFRVLYVDSLGLRRPAAHVRDLARVWKKVRRSRGGVRKVRENLHVLSPLVFPAHGCSLIRRLNDRVLLGLVRSAIKKLRFESPIVWTYNPLVARIAQGLRSKLIVYHCVDDLSAAPGLPRQAILRGEQAMAGLADVIFTTSPALQARFDRSRRGNVFYFPNVADYDHFARARRPGPIPADLAKIPAPRIGFVGTISSYKLDFELIAAAAQSRPDRHWAMIGPVGEGQPGTDIAALRQPNIHLLGPRTYAELPDYLRGFDLAVIPAASNPYTAAMFPMKFFEYLAAGLPVVAANVPALSAFATACCQANGLEAFSQAIDGVLAGDCPDATSLQGLAKAHTWKWRLDEMLAVMQQRAQRRSERLAA